MIRGREVGRFVLRDFVLEEIRSAEKTQCLVEGPDTVLIESRGTVAFCLTDFKEPRFSKPGSQAERRKQSVKH